MDVATTGLFERALERLDTLGWRQDTFGPSGSARCLVGHVSDALRECHPERCEDPTLLTEVGSVLSQAIYVREGHYGIPMCWNDEDGRTVEEVRLVLKEAGTIRPDL